MPSPTSGSIKGKLTPEILALCLLLACSFQIIENLLPKIPIFPWLRLGLTYLILLPFLLRFGAHRTLLLFLSRNLIALVYGGQIFSSFIISSLSGIVTLGIIGPAAYYLYQKKISGLWGTSILLACFFNITQLFVVNFFFVRHGDFFFQLWPLMIWSLVSGSLIAFLVYKSGRGLDRLFDSRKSVKFFSGSMQSDDEQIDRVGLAIAVSVFISLFLFTVIWFQLILLAILLVATQFKNLKTVLIAWPFYFYIVWLHLFRTDGVFIFRDWITQEGLDNFIFYAIRTTNIIICGQWLARYIPSLWKKFSGSVYMTGLGYALPLLPALFGLSIAMGKEFFNQLRRGNFENVLYLLVDRLEQELSRISAVNERPEQ